MSSSIRRLLGPARKRLIDMINEKPELRQHFDNVRQREDFRSELEKYKANLVKRYEAFRDLHQRLISGDYDAEEQEAVNELAEADQRHLFECDDVLVEIELAFTNLLRLENEEQRARENEEKLRRQEERVQQQQNEERRQHQLQREQLEIQRQAAAREREQRMETGAAQAVHVKLPKLNLVKFGGDILKWQEFWDSFQSSIHENRNIPTIDKMNYLKAQLEGDAKKAIEGLAATNDNYTSAVNILKRRFGEKQKVVDAHYTALMDLAPASNQTQKLRKAVDAVKLHLYSLEALEENIQHNHMLSLIRSKLPSDVLIRLNEINGEKIVDIPTFRRLLLQYLANREDAESRLSPPIKSKSDTNPTTKPFSTMRATTDALFLHTDRTASKRTCAFCEKGHHSSECCTYSTLEERKRKLGGNKCYVCLLPGHTFKKCKSKKPCYYCKKTGHHHQSLCPSKFLTSPTSLSTISSAAIASKTDDIPTATIAQSIMEKSSLATGHSVMLQTATTTVHSINNKNSIQTRLLFDSGSQRSYVSARLANILNLKQKAKENLLVYTFGSLPPKEIKTSVVDLCVKLMDGSLLKLSANVVPTITGGIERMPIDIKLIDPLIRDRLADSIPMISEKSSIDVLIGNDYYWDFIMAQKIEISNGLYLISSKLGWVLSGRYHNIGIDHQLPSTTLFTQSIALPNLDFSFSLEDAPLVEKLDLKTLWDVETLGIKDRIDDVDDEEALQKFNDSIRYSNGRYYVTWPWKNGESDLPSNYKLSLGRLNSMLRRYKGQTEIFDKYQAVIDSQLQNGIIEKVDHVLKEGTLQHYIPHHAVIMPDKETTKLRIVYDGSAKSKKENKSINECLYRGPVMMEDICSLLIRFRLNKIAIIADIEKAFLQVGLQEADRDVTRFLWLRDPKKLTTENNLQIYRFTRVPFGIISSPFLLAATITYHLNKIGGEIATMLRKNIYVDNVICGTDTDAHAFELYKTAKEIFHSAAMNLREWNTNSVALGQQIPTTDRTAKSINKVLGIKWDSIEDQLSIYAPTNPPANIISKRIVLKFIASIFDPLGLFCPSILLLKQFLQKLWVDKYDWDDTLTPALNSEWKNLVSQTTPIWEFKLPRFIGQLENTKNRNELHCFCDSSTNAYGVCIYLRLIGLDSISAHLLFAKSRLAPMQGITVPRLELIAVQIGSRCLAFVERSLPFSIASKTLWTDSRCVLHWINSKKPLSIFVRNRISEIKKLSNVKFRYVPTTENPADIASRGKLATALFTYDSWWYGPPWLTHANELSWPSMDFLCNENDEPNGEKAILFSTSALAREGANASDDTNIKTPFGIDEKRYSSFTKLLRVTAWVMRFINRLKRLNFDQNHLTADDILNAKIIWIKFTQHSNYHDVFSAIEEKRRHPLVENFGIWIDKNGLLRCGGRLLHANLPDLAKYPIFLPKKGHFTTLIIRDFHRKLFHAGVSHTLAQLRNEFWIPSGRALVFKIIRLCTDCKKYDGGPYKLPCMPPLPKSRVTPTAPFSTTGLDYLGPLYVKKFANITTTEKVWICLFTCLSTRAVHLEVISDMTAEQFLLCLRRFIARRGKPSLIISDNAPQFKLASSAIEKLWKRVIANDSINNYFSNENIKWRFIVERAPWMGGFYERLVRLVKQALRKSLGKICLTFTQLQTLITEIEAVINSRPLAYVGADFPAGTLITPAHFLSPHADHGIPAFDAGSKLDTDRLQNISAKDHLIENWKRGHRHLEHFWKLWRDDYLLNLRERSKQQIKQPYVRSSGIPNVGDVVLVKNDGPRGSWKLARITKLPASLDGKFRSAEIKTSTGTTMNRSLTHLYPLECNEPELGELIKMKDDSVEVTRLRRPKRRMAKGVLAKDREETKDEQSDEFSDEF